MSYNYTETDHYHQARRELDSLEPLPSADELAEPVVQAITALAAAFDQRANTIAFGIEHGAFIHEADELVATAHRVAALVASAVSHHSTGTRDVDAENARTLMLALTGTRAAEDAILWRTVDRIAGTDTTA